jgi:anti-sigma factor RsiW
MTDEELVAYADGELTGEAARRIEAAMATDAELRTRIGTLMLQREQLRANFESIVDEPVPERLRAAALSGPVSWQMRLRESFGSTASAGSLVRLATTAAAALIIGIVAGRMMGDTGVIGTSNDAMLARGDLARSLETRLAAETGAGPHIGVSFRDKNGANCRTFATAGTAGIACKASDGWHIAALSRTETQSGGDFQAAGSAMPDAIRNAVTQMIDGSPFDAAAERHARDAGWK